ncbi:uncharacterized protein LOC122501694 [Leptopilina heterotoma]|uniref:uncharacterized protein LOC122501694 n=1 Tax=Leptopilina heterotoma TaxID=63436 RepID=UPI001CA82C36|nr:uncharacterized protein LOC122501694 [Leptopilina heterotoma]
MESGEFWIGAHSNKKDIWYWIDNNKKLKLDHTFMGGFRLWDPSEFVSSVDSCLTIYGKRHNIPTFIPLQCSKKRTFICERVIDKIGIEANKIGVVKIENGEFVLYSAKATWAEAVAYCRLQNFQIAEVKSKEEARLVASSMLKARPDKIESAWIGGHFKNNIWKWVASNEIIDTNKFWSNNTLMATGCLLLDSHIFEEPVYISAKCNRKRNILCQKTTAKELISKLPTPLEVDGCPYWIGTYPLNWLDASRACLAINASLVIFDSAEIINHMMNLMADYNHELRRIWTDGYRRQNISKEGNNHWYWKSTGNPISESNFIPWCSDCYGSEYENCLNLERDNRKTPVVYGLNCKRNQTYVCQPWKGHCVSHRVQDDLLMNSDFLNLYSGLADMKPVKTPTIVLSQNSSTETKEENVPFLYEDVSNMKTFHSTESYYSSSLSYATSQQVNFFLKEEATVSSVIKEISKKFEDNHKNSKYNLLESTEVNETNSLNFIIQLFSLQFTLPSLPQFGIIKVVSAEDANPENVSQKEFSKTHEFENTEPTFEQTATTNAILTEEIVTTDGLYGANVDYDDSASTTSEIVERITEATTDKEFLKTNETLIAANITKDLNISAILQKVIEEELQLLNQKNEYTTSRKFLTNSGSTSEPENETEIIIPPYFAIESPLSVELSADMDNFVPTLKTTERTITNEGIITKKTPDYDDLKINPYDKNSMLQLGRFFKNIFADKTSNAQTINLNLISRPNSPEDSQSILEKNYIQRDTKGRKEHIETSDSPSTFPLFYRLVDLLKKSDSNSKNGNNKKSAGSNPQKLFNILKNLINGVRIDINETRLKTYVQKFVREKLSKIYDSYSSKSDNWRKNFENILKLLNGTTVNFQGERVQIRLGSFAYKKQPVSQEKEGKRIENKTKPLNDEKNSFSHNHYPYVNKSTKQRSKYEKEYISNDGIFSKVLKRAKSRNQVVKKSINAESTLLAKTEEASITNSDSKKSSKVSEMVSIYFILKQSNDLIPILELHIRMPANSNFDKGSIENSRSLRRSEIKKIDSAEKFENSQIGEGNEKFLELDKKKLSGEENRSALNYKKRSDFVKNIISNVTDFGSISDLRRKRQLLFLALKYLKLITDEREKELSGG